MHNKILTQTFIIAAMMITLASCSDSDDQAINEELLDVVWSVDTLFTPEVQFTPSPDTLMTLRLLRDTSIEADTPCNDYSGTYGTDKYGSIVIEWYTWTEMACTARGGFLEGIFVNALENVTAYEMDEDRLILYDSNRNYVVKLRN